MQSSADLARENFYPSSNSEILRDLPSISPVFVWLAVTAKGEVGLKFKNWYFRKRGSATSLGTCFLHPSFSIMQKIIIPVVLLLLWLGGGTWYWTCEVRQCNCGGTAQAASPKAASQAPEASFFVFDLTADSARRFEAGSALRFAVGAAEPFVPGAVLPQLDALAAFLRENPQQQLQLIGQQHAGEGGEGLALQRARALFGPLAERGVSPDQLIALPEQLDTPAPAGDSLSGGVVFSLLPQLAEAESDNDSASLAANLPEPFALRFATNASDLPLSATERQAITQLIQYLRAHPEARLRLTGHTDNTGQTGNNRSLGRARAATVRDFFTAFGLDPGRIEIDSRGDQAPIAPNDTEAGRARNRRVEVGVRELDI
jgi:OmpA-OmpF porin, OOP family